MLPGDVQWSSGAAGEAVIEQVDISQGSWIEIGDPLFLLRTAGGQVTLWSTYIGRIESVSYEKCDPLALDRPLLTLAVSGWLHRFGAPVPFDTGLLLSTGVPPPSLDPNGTASRLLVTIDELRSRPVPWGTSCLLYVPAGVHVVSAIYEQPGAHVATASKTLKIRPGRWSSLTYEPPRAAGGSGKLRS